VVGAPDPLLIVTRGKIMNAETLASGAGESPRTPYPLSPPLKKRRKVKELESESD
jgi:hypothetical protein